jgi:hypothetical protein
MDPAVLSNSPAGINALTLQLIELLRSYKSATQDGAALRAELDALCKNSQQLATFLNSDRVAQKQFVQTRSVLDIVTKDCTSTLNRLKN